MTTTVPDHHRPERWWSLNPEGHGFLVCGQCRAKVLDLTCSVPVLNDKPLCAWCAGAVLTSEGSLTGHAAAFALVGDPRWWSEWLCNCHFCDAESLGESVQ